jgi:D-alanyl-D-alanine carboxypeptidase
MMATRSDWLPVAGEVTNTNTLLGHVGFVGMKTGSDEAAGGCLMFRSVRHTKSGNRSLIGVVLGQRGDNLIKPSSWPTAWRRRPAHIASISKTTYALATPRCVN